MKQSIIFFIVGVVLFFSLTFVTAQIQTLPTQDSDSCVDLPQVCSTCTYVNVSSIKPPLSPKFYIDEEMTKVGPDFNYTFCNTSELGWYIVTTCGDKDGVFSCSSFDFEVRNGGRVFTLSETLIYSLFLLFCVVMIYYSIKLTVKNPFGKDPLNSYELYQLKKRNEFLYFLSVLKSKMWIVGLFGIYIFLLLFLSLTNQMMYSLGFMVINSLLINIVTVLLWSLIPFVVFWLVYIIIVFYKSSTTIFKYQFGVLGQGIKQ